MSSEGGVWMSSFRSGYKWDSSQSYSSEERCCSSTSELSWGTEDSCAGKAPHTFAEGVRRYIDHCESEESEDLISPQSRIRTPEFPSSRKSSSLDDDDDSMDDDKGRYGPEEEENDSPREEVGLMMKSLMSLFSTLQDDRKTFLVELHRLRAQLEELKRNGQAEAELKGRARKAGMPEAWLALEASGLPQVSTASGGDEGFSAGGSPVPNAALDDTLAKVQERLRARAALAPAAAAAAAVTPDRRAALKEEIQQLREQVTVLRTQVRAELHRESD